MKSCLLIFSAVWAATMTSFPALADNEEQQLIEKVVEAYGGAALTNLPRLEFTDHTKRLNFGQSASPLLVDIGHYQASVFVDFENSRKSWRSASWSGDGRYTQNQFFDGTTGYSVNHSKQKYSQERSISFASADRRLSYTLDTILARMLHDSRDDATLSGQEELNGVVHHKVSFQASGHPQLTLFVQDETGRISMATRPHWMEGEVHTYRFDNHQRVGDLLYAGDTYVYNRSEPRTVTVSRTVSLQPDDQGLFDIPATYEQEGQGLDFSEMIVNEIADGVYVAGQDWGFSLFVDEGDYYTAAGGYDRFPERLAAVQSLTGTQKPVRYFVISHHHMDHIGGVRELDQLGVTFILHPDHLATVERALGRQLDEEERMLVPGADNSFGRVRLIDIPSGHSRHNLGTYVRDEGVMFTADMFFSRQQEGGIRASSALLSTLQSIGLRPGTFVAAHSSRPLTYRDLEQAVASAPDDVCPASWLLCERR